MNPPLFGLLLAGGRSTRMGLDKASMVLGADGLNQAARAIQALSRACDKTFLSLRDGQAAPEGCEDSEIVRDKAGLNGPLAGILAAFEREPEAAWLVMACDLPFVGSDLLNCLVAARAEGFDFFAYASVADGLPEPLCAIYEPSALAVLQTHAARGCISPRQIMAAGRTRLLDLPPANRRALQNMNTPEDIAAVSLELETGTAHP
jgi:molybdopterin-guanine dinucleotide biosynthesis protein A